MNEKTIVEYSFVILEEYRPLIDGSPNFHYNPAVEVSGQGTIAQFLDTMQKNSNTEGLSIVNINFKIIE